MAGVDGSSINLLGAAETISADIQQNSRDVHAEVIWVYVKLERVPQAHMCPGAVGNLVACVVRAVVGPAKESIPRLSFRTCQRLPQICVVGRSKFLF